MPRRSCCQAIRGREGLLSFLLQTRLLQVKDQAFTAADPMTACRVCLLQVKQALPALARLIHSQDEEVLTDACWALSYLSDGTNDKIQDVIQAGVCRRLVELLL